MNELKYEAKQKIIVVLGSLTGQKGWIIQRCEDSSGFDYLVGFPDTRANIRTELMTQDYLMSLDELQTLRTENERLIALVEKIYAEVKEVVFHLNTDTYQADSEVRDSMEYIEMWILHYKSGVDVQ